jgi:putative DNA primase/helicase
VHDGGVADRFRVAALSAAEGERTVTAAVAADQRYSCAQRCPICGGAEVDQRGQGQRCIGYYSADREFARCSRRERAGVLEIEDTTLCYVHRLAGPCRCGEQHGEQRRESVGKGPIVDSYDYTNENGAVLYRVDRRITPGGQKTFSQRRPDGRGGWINGTSGVRQVPFKLPELIAADPVETVFVVEGEKCAMALHKLGLLATTARGGTGGVKQWDSPEFCAPFNGRNVVVLPDVDADGKGRRYAERVAEALAAGATTVKVVDLPGLQPVGEDVVEWLERGGAREQLLQLAKAAGEVKAPANSPTAPTVDSAPTLALTETGNAERFANANVGRALFIKEWSRWNATDPAGRWREDIGEIRVSGLVKESARDLYQIAARTADDRVRGAIVAWAKSSERRTVREATLKLARSEPGIAASFRDFDADPWLLGTPGGIVDLRTGSVRPLRPEDLVSRTVAVNFDPSAVAPRWERFLREVLPDISTAQFFQRAIGYALTGVVSEHCLFFCYGQGANGKSTAFKVLLELMGDYAVQAPSSLLLARRGEAHPTELTILHGRRFVACQEVDESRRWAEAQLKHITGGDAIAARRMREDFWTFEPHHKLFLAANHKPEVRGGDVGIWRRIRLIPFEVVIPEKDRDPRLDEALHAELAGILNWAVKGCLDWQRNGLGTSQAVLDATAAYRADSDLVGRWISDECAIDAGAAPRTRSAVRAAFERWCEREGESPLNARSFTERLRLLGLQEVKGVREGDHRERGWRGLCLHVDTSKQESQVIPHAHTRRGHNPESVSTSVDVSTTEPRGVSETQLEPAEKAVI